MLSNPAVAQTMNEALSNPAFVDQMIQSHPALANNPHARGDDSVTTTSGT